MSDLLRLVLLSHRPRRMAQRGFVLPTTVLLVLMVVLTATALTYRVVSRSQTSIAQREQVVVASAAAPAIDRAKAKIEFLFKGDTRLPPGLPTSAILVSMLRNDGSASIAALTDDPYTLPGEARLDINGDGTLDTAWSFEDRSTTPTRTVVYSILAADQGTVGTTAYTVTSPESLAKARSLVTRTGPLDIEGARPNCPGSVQSQNGWFPANPSNSSRLLKNFQINVFMSGGTDVSRTREAFEFQESRAADRLNKWAAWFRTDLEVSPDANFAFNGAMHTDGSLIVGGSSAFDSYMVSSQASCVYSADASEITMRQTGDGSTFQGQAMLGMLADNSSTAGDVTFHVWNGDNSAPDTDEKLTSSSVSSGTPEDVSLDPLELVNNDTLKHRGSLTRNPNWQDDPLRVGVAGKPRIYNDNYLDRLSNVLNLSATNRNQFWEQQAISSNEGMRLIVGQRLELGNPNQWNFNPFSGVNPEESSSVDRLYPPDADPSVTGKVGVNEYRQKRTLQDNLSAVQGMAVYPSTSRDFPTACLAFTSHPGTPSSIVNSRTFAYYPNATTLLKTDFLNGVGTNGWEFSWKDTAFETEAGFVTEIADGKPLGVALRNLARFAGDPQTANPYPNPFFGMWGDFSQLRKVLAKVDSGTAYASLTSEEQTTLHSAACTVSLLAYNLKADYEELQKVLDTGLSSFQSAAVALKDNMDLIISYQNGDYDSSFNSNSGKTTGNLTKALDVLVSIGKLTQAEVDAIEQVADLPKWVDTVTTVVPAAAIPSGKTNPCPAGTDTLPAFNTACDVGEYFAEYSLDDWLKLLEESMSGTPANIQAAVNAIKNFANIVQYNSSIIRDRDLGFRKGDAVTKLTPPSANNNVKWDSGSGFTEPVGPSSKQVVYKTSCAPDLFTQVIAKGGGGKDDQVALTLVACSESEIVRIRYPSMYYLFPLVNHDHNGTGYHQQPNGSVNAQPGELYITNSYVTSVNPDLDASAVPTDLNSYTYRVVGTDKFTGLHALAAVPRNVDLSGWVLPAATNGTTLTTADIDNPTYAFRINRPGGAADVPILDKGLFDGREQMAVRVADLDLKAFTQTSTTGKVQIPNASANAIVYASREDAVADTTPTDFLPDPNRRPHGFRLRNGEDLSNNKARTGGLTFVTNNSAYIMGNFNLHSTNGTDRIEEFTATLGDNAWTTSNFYNSRTSGTLNSNFAQLATDTWRPTEILADAITILSGAFKDGAVEDTFKPTSAGLTSYMNQRRRPGIDADVKRENTYFGAPTTPAPPTGRPVWINRNGNAFTTQLINGLTGWTSSTNGQVADNTYVNASFFSGMAPSRKQQSNGGLPNFVRLTELWAGKILNIQGAFIQFDFSRMATAPFDQEAWEEPPAAEPRPLANTEQTGYYSAPDRRWRYDVGLLYQPPAAAASRFLSLRSPRSEYFRTLPNDDPYITILRCAEQGGSQVFPDEVCN